MSEFFTPVQSDVQRADGSLLRALSASSISTLLVCPEQFRRSYLMQQWPAQSGVALLGSAYHRARQLNFEQKVFSGKDLPLEQVLAAYDSAWVNEVNRGPVRWRNDDPTELRELGARMTEQYHRTLARVTKPIAVEETFEREVPGVPLPIVGRIDVRDEKNRIIDIKTGRQGATKPQPEWRIQALVYLYAWPEYDFAWHVHARSGNQKLYAPSRHPSLLLRNTPSKRRIAERLIQDAWEQIADLYAKRGIETEWPGDGLSSSYACMYCDHRIRCFWQA